MGKRRTIFCAALVVLTTVAVVRAERSKLVDAPIVWYENDRGHIDEPKERDPSIRWDYFEDSWSQPRERLTSPVRLVRRIGTLFGADQVPLADNINTLGEVANSTWFNNRIGIFPMTPEDAASGPGAGSGPDRTGPWVIISAKTEGVTPGFNIKDARGDVYVIKFDPSGFLGMTSAAGVISNRILHAAGYNVPEDAVVTFRREDVVLGDGVKIKTPDGTKRPMTVADIEEILGSVDKLSDDEWLAISSKFLSGKPVGPFDYRGRREDDANDHVKHQHRRELRALYVFAAWINHFDVKQHNSLDMYVTENGKSFIKHHLIDFASTLGAGASGLNPRYGYEFGFDPLAIGRRTFTLGLVEDRWRKLERSHGFNEVGFFDAEYFDPGKFRSLQPNSAFANMTDRDGYWAAKIVAAFSDDHIRAIVAHGEYRAPGAAEYVAGILAQRRDMIARHYFDRVPPLDFFSVDGDAVRFQDLGVKYDIYAGTSTRYRVRLRAVNADRSAAGGSMSAWMDIANTRVSLTSDATSSLQGTDATQYPFLAMEVQVNRGGGWSDSVTAYLARASQRIVAVDR